jgi:hypothetical protein
MRFIRRAFLIVLAIMVPLYAVSLTERLEIPASWRSVQAEDSHADVRARLRESGMDDRQCEWFAGARIVRCTLVGRHHAGGVEIIFNGNGTDARVEQVRVHEPLYTGPFHLHARWRNWVR